MQTEAKAVTLADIGRVRLVSSLFMGLGQIVYLKNYVMGGFYALIEILTLLNLPGIINKLIGLITLGEENLSVPVTERDHSIFMMIDGILVLGVIAKRNPAPRLCLGPVSAMRVPVRLIPQIS